MLNFSMQYTELHKPFYRPRMLTNSPVSATLTRITVFALKAVATCIAFAGAVSHAADWVEIPRGGVDRIIFLDKSSIADVDGYRKAWNVGSFLKLQDMMGVKFMSALQLDLFACDRREIATKALHLYSGKAATGNLVKKIEIPADRLVWTDIPPDSGHERLHAAVCLNRYEK